MSDYSELGESSDTGSQRCARIRRHKATAQMVSAILTSLAAVLLIAMLLYLLMPGGIISRIDAMQRELEAELATNRVYDRFNRLLNRSERAMADAQSTLVLWNETIVEPQTLTLFQNITAAVMESFVTLDLLGELRNVTMHVDATLVDADRLLDKACDLARALGVHCP